MKKKKHFSRAATLWCVSYFLLLAIFLGSIGVMFTLNQSLIRKTNDKYCQTILNGISENAKDAVGMSQKLYSYVVNHSDINDILSIEKEEDYFTSSKVRLFLKELTEMKEEMDFYIYIPHTNMFLTPNGCFNSHLYYKAKYAPRGISFEDWMEYFTSEVQEPFFPFSEENEKDIVFRDKYVSPEGKSMLLLTSFDEKFLFNLNEQPEWMAKSDIYVSNLKGEIYLSSRKSGITADIKNKDDIVKNYSKEWETVEKTEVSALPMIITIAYFKKAALTEINLLNRMQLVLITLLLFLSAAVIFSSLKRSYKPISSILNKLNISESRNEYEDIEKGIGELLDKYKHYVRQTEQFTQEHTKVILSNCFAGNYSSDYTLKLLKENNIEFPYKYFALCIFDIADISELFGRFDSKDVPREQKFKELTIILENILTELFGEKECDVKVIAVAEDIFAVINTDIEDAGSNGVIYATIKKSLELIREHFFIKISFAQSEIYRSMGHLSKAYNQVKYLMQYKNAVQMTEPICANDIQIGPCGEIAELFSAETESKLIKYVASGDIENAENTINYIFAGLAGLKPSLEQMQCFMIDLGCILYKIPQEVVDIDFEKILKASASSSQMQKFLMETVRDICSKMHISVTKVDKTTEIKLYIDKNYSNDMDLSSLANLFGLSASYLSRHFKKVAGIALPDYINKTRLFHAKDLLKNSNKPIKDIAVKVGYENLRSFNRIFQKYEGMTPSHYRNSMK